MGVGSAWGRSSDEELLQVSRHAPAAFGEFYARHEKRMLQYSRAGDADVAADLTAETFAAALAGSRRFRARKGPAAGWLFGIAHNTLAMSQRRGRVETRARARIGTPPLDLTDDLVKSIAALSGEALELVQPPADERRAVRARIVDERAYPEIAKDLRCSEDVVRKRVSRGLARLRDEMEGA
jgi:RNA polymerase sigma factor (sigma-70 family)